MFPEIVLEVEDNVNVDGLMNPAIDYQARDVPISDTGLTVAIPRIHLNATSTGGENNNDHTSSLLSARKSFDRA